MVSFNLFSPQTTLTTLKEFSFNMELKFTESRLFSMTISSSGSENVMSLNHSGVMDCYT